MGGVGTKEKPGDGGTEKGVEGELRQGFEGGQDDVAGEPDYR